MKREYDKTKQPKALGDSADYICRKTFRNDLGIKYGDRRIGDIAKDEDKHVIDVLLDVSEADDWKTQWATPTRNHSPELCKEMLTHQTVAGFSDGGAHTKFSHLGSFPTDLLTWMVRDTNTIKLEEAHYKLSFVPAWVAGFKDRGSIREGLAADLMIYDLEKLAVNAPEVANDIPPNNNTRLVQRPTGYRWIMCNGEVTFENGDATGANPGKLLRCADAR